MDNDKRSSAPANSPVVAQQVGTVNPAAAPQPPQAVPAQTPIQQEKPGLAIPDSAALDLLAINNLQTAPHSSHKFPTKMIIILAVMLLLVIAASMAPGLLKSEQASNGSRTQTNSSTQHTSHTGNSSDTSRQIDEDVRSCVNPVNAVTSC
ncbi:MAG TPA: hypothetical protein VLF59_02045 [Candidatus Saccharimonadales bacterium]|nr:hypothetical protein [Candidatus Saccharimonadales bacterium]